MFASGGTKNDETLYGAVKRSFLLLGVQRNEGEARDSR